MRGMWQPPRLVPVSSSPFLPGNSTKFGDARVLSRHMIVGDKAQGDETRDLETTMSSVVSDCHLRGKVHRTRDHPRGRIGPRYPPVGSLSSPLREQSPSDYLALYVTRAFADR